MNVAEPVSVTATSGRSPRDCAAAAPMPKPGELQGTRWREGGWHGRRSKTAPAPWRLCNPMGTAIPGAGSLRASPPHSKDDSGCGKPTGLSSAPEERAEQRLRRQVPAGEYTAVPLPKLRRALKAFSSQRPFQGQEEHDEADANMDRGRSARRTLEALADAEASTQALQERDHAMDVAEDEPGGNSEPVVSMGRIPTLQAPRISGRTSRRAAT